MAFLGKIRTLVVTIIHYIIDSDRGRWCGQARVLSSRTRLPRIVNETSVEVLRDLVPDEKKTVTKKVDQIVGFSFGGPRMSGIANSASLSIRNGRLCDEGRSGGGRSSLSVSVELLGEEK